MDQEIVLVWRSPWSIPKALYLVSRYVGLGTSILTAVVSTFDNIDSFCRVFNPIQYFFILVTLTIPDALLLLRVLAVFQGKLWLRRTLLSLYAALLLLQIVLIGLEFKRSIVFIPEQNNFGCLDSTGVPYVISISSIAVLAFNTLLFILLLVALVTRWPRETKMTFTPLVALLIRDGSVYFALILSVYATLTVMPFTLHNRPDIELFALPWAVAIGPLASCRLYLNLKGSRKPPADEPDSYTTETYSGSLVGTADTSTTSYLGETDETC